MLLTCPTELQKNDFNTIFIIVSGTMAKKILKDQNGLQN